MLLQTIYVAYDFHLLGYTSFDFVNAVLDDLALWVRVMYVGGEIDDTSFFMIYGLNGCDE